MTPQSFFLCLKRVATHIQTWFGLVSGVLGFLTDATGTKVPALSTIFWLVALSCAFWVALKIEDELLREKEKNHRPEPNMPLAEVVKRITQTSALPSSSDQPDSYAVTRACDAIREKAMLGLITVFGGINFRITRPSDYDRMMRDRIPQEYWREHTIDVIGFLGDDDHKGRTQDLGNTKSVLDKDLYYGIWFDRRQVDNAWPEPRRRAQWRSPLSFNT